MNKQLDKWKEKLEGTNFLFYGELEFYMDRYIKEFFSVEIKEVGYNENHPMNNLQFWFMVSILDKMDMVSYGTSPRGAWLTEDGKMFKDYCLTTESPISNLLNEIDS